MPVRKPISINSRPAMKRAEYVAGARSIEAFINARLGDAPRIFTYIDIAAGTGVRIKVIRFLLWPHGGSENSIRW
jgi:hypothetical protein